MLPRHMSSQSILARTMLSTVTTVIASRFYVLSLYVLGEICGPFRSVPTVQTSPKKTSKSIRFFLHFWFYHCWNTIENKNNPSSTAVHFYDFSVDVSSKRECLGIFCYSRDSTHSDAQHVWTPHASLCHTCCDRICRSSRCSTKPFYPLHPPLRRLCHQNILKSNNKWSKVSKNGFIKPKKRGDNNMPVLIIKSLNFV